jgi:hypothetical protein
MMVFSTNTYWAKGSDDHTPPAMGNFSMDTALRSARTNLVEIYDEQKLSHATTF